MLRTCLVSSSLCNATRRFSTCTSTRLEASHSIYVSKSTNPYFNLSVEDWLFRHKSHTVPLLLLYRDDPCVVIGRNQNPWKEVNLVACRRRDVPFLRRKSGGGTVYHDLGNTNFSIHVPRSSFDRHATAQIVLRAVRSLGVEAHVNDRNDICVGPDKICSAYKIVNNRAYHHGTMLISTRLDMLSDLLRVKKDTMETKGVTSVRSPVRNLQQYTPGITHEGFVFAIIRSFQQAYGITDPINFIDEDEVALGVQHIRQSIEELQSWDWAFGQTPEFTYTVSQAFSWATITARILSKHGIILDCPFTLADSTVVDLSSLQVLSENLKGQKYAFLSETPDIKALLASDDRVQEVWRWLRHVMEN
ncbi:Lipoyltransferase and lipoate-protein ligase [Panus rudis PR-1116 ss-1]|nr:Lipoyltransferase and lipoate-protein ligase [Panus rudis PR-1116 ss-1]